MKELSAFASRLFAFTINREPLSVPFTRMLFSSSCASVAAGENRARSEASCRIHMSYDNAAYRHDCCDLIKSKMYFIHPLRVSYFIGHFSPSLVEAFAAQRAIAPGQLEVAAVVSKKGGLEGVYPEVLRGRSGIKERGADYSADDVGPQCSRPGRSQKRRSVHTPEGVSFFAFSRVRVVT